MPKVAAKQQQQQQLCTLLPDSPEVDAAADENGIKRISWRDDIQNIVLLIYMYVMQGIPLGLCSSIPYILQSKHVNFKNQATFVFSTWPFAFKFLYAPVIDSLYIPRLGLRKSWLLFSQLAIAAVMFYSSGFIDSILEISNPDVNSLLMVFLTLSLFSSIQDVAVDGWALTMLSRKNISWASTCNIVGQSAGIFIGNSLFLALNSAHFSNSYIRPLLNFPASTLGVVTLSQFFKFWSVVFFISTLLIALMKAETSFTEDVSLKSVLKTYRVFWNILKLSSVRQLALMHLTSRIGFTAVDNLVPLELIERGVTKESLALISVLLTPVQIFFPLFLSRYLSGAKPLQVFIKTYPMRLIFNLIFVIFVYLNCHDPRVDLTWPSYILLIFIYMTYQIFCYCTFLSEMAFHAQISDPRLGGTYMTMTNALSNFGSSWPSPIVIYLAGISIYKKCSLLNIRCSNAQSIERCELAGGFCFEVVDPFYLIISVCALIGALWYFNMKQRVIRLQYLPLSDWMINSHTIRQI